MAKLSFRVQADYDKVQRLREEISKLKQEVGNINAIQNPTAFNNLNNKLQQTSKELGNVTGKIAQASATMETDFRKKIYDASQGVNTFTEKIIAQKAVVKDVEADVIRLGEEYRKAVKYSPMSADGKLAEWTAARKALSEEKAALFGLTQEQATARLSVKKLRDEYALFKEEGGGTAQTMDLLTSKMKGIAATVMGGMGLKELASHIISVRAEFESMETSLKVLLGGNQERLNSIMAQIKEYALASSLNTKDMVGAVQMMTSFGIEAEKSIDYLKAIGDISMGDTGKFNSLALAFSQMSAAGKLMGQDLNQMVGQGFNPLEEISRKTGKSIGELKEEMSKGAITSKMVQDAFISVTSAGGKFYGMSAEGAKTLNGQISMLQESFDNMFNEIGSKGEGVVMGAVKLGTSLVENYEQVGRVILGLITTYGTYRTALAIATVAQNGHTLAMTLARAQILLTQKAQALLNATMLANPYVLAATALGVLVGGIIAAQDGLTNAERAQNAFNDEVKSGEEALAKYNSETEQAIANASNDSAATDDRRKALNLLIERYPSIIKKYIDEEGHLKNILGLKQEIAAMDGQMTMLSYKGKAKDARKAADAFKLVKQAKQKAVSSGMSESSYTNFLTKEQQASVKWANMWYDQNAKPKWYNRGTTQDRLEFAQNFAKNADAKVSRTYTEQSVESFQKAIASMNRKRLATLKAALDKSKNNKGYTTLPYKELNGAVLSSKDVNTLSTYVDGIISSRKTGKTTKKDLQDQKKALQAELDGLSEIEAKGKKGAALKKKIAAITERENAYSTSTGGKNGGNTGGNGGGNTEPVKVDYDKLKREQEESEKDLANRASQAYIDSLQDGYEKERLQREFNHKKELDDLDKYKQDFLQKKIEQAKTLFEADAKNEGKTFNASSVVLSADEQAQFDKMRSDIISKQEREESTFRESQQNSLRAYLQEYGSMQEKRAAINDEYNDKIAKSDDAVEKARLAAERDRKQAELDFKALQESINWEDVFRDMDRHSTAYLKDIKAKLKGALSAKEVTPENAKVLVDKIAEIDDTIGSREDFWSSLLPGLKDRKRLIEETASAQERLNKATSEYNGASMNVLGDKIDIQTELGKAGVNVGINEISAESQDRLLASLEKGTPLYNGLLNLFRKLAADTANANAKQENMGKARTSLDVSLDKLKNLSNLSDIFSWAKKGASFGEIITGVNQNVQSMSDLSHTIGLGDTEFGKAVDNFADGCNEFTGVVQSLASGDVFGAVNHAIKGIQSWGSIFGIGGGNKEEVRKLTERLTKSNENLADRIDDLSEVIGDSSGAKAVNAYDTALKAQEEINKNNMEILKAQMEYHSAHHSNAYYSDDKTIASYNADAQLAFKAAGVQASTITGLSSIYNLTPEQLKAIKDFSPDLWKYLTEVGKYDKSEYWDAVVEQAGKTAELTEQIQNNLTQTSFDSMRSNFLDTLTDMDSDAEDWANSFEKMLFKSLVNNSILDDEFDKWLEAFQEKWAEKIKSGNMSQQDYADYRKEYDSKMQELKTQTNNLAAAVGYDGTSSSQNATANGISNISYDQADNLTGIMTSMQIAGEQRNTKLDTVGAQMTLMNTRVDDIRVSQMQIRDIANNTRDILANSYMELKEINLNTGNSEKHLKEMKSDISDMKRIIKDKL